MHSKSLPVRLGLIGLFFILFSSHSQAQTVTYDVLLNTDNNTTTGCDATPTAQGSIGGFERRVRAIVDGPTLTVTEVSVAFCEGTGFGAAVVTGGGHAVGLNNGFNGTDVVELSASLNSLAPLTNGAIQVSIIGDDSVGSDLLETTTGMAGSDPILIFIPIAVPALGIFGLLLLVAAIAVITIRGRQRRWLSISLLAASGIVFAASFIVDGQVTDWGGVNPDATDPADDSTNGAAGNDIQAFFAALENDTLFLRLDVTDLENQPPIVVDDAFTVLEDDTLNEPAPGVLGNDSDPDMDPITANLVTGPTNAQAFTLNADGSFDYTPNADFNGIDTFTYVANDGFIDSDLATATITVTPVNDVPSFTVPADTTVLEDAGAQTMAGFATAISAGPPDEAGQTLTFNITNNDNGALFDVAPALASDGTLSFTAADDANGTANITVELMDDGGTANGGVDTTAPQTFAIIVTAVNDAPTITIAGDADVLEDAGAQSLAGFATDILAGPPDEVAQTLTLAITDNDNPGLFSAAPDLALDGTLTFTAADDANGTANITIELTDDGGTADGGVDTSGPITFAINVTAVNDEPEFTLTGDPATILEDAGAQAVAGFATGISAGPADENTQILTFNVTGNTNPALFSAVPAIDPASGELTYTPADDANGTADITVELMDDGGTADGGDDTSAPQMFTITVTAVNDTPVFTAGVAPDVPEDAGPQMIAGFATGISAGPTDENTQALTFNITNNTNAGLFSAAPALATDGTLTYTPAANVSGAADITVELMDDGGTADGGDDTSDPQTFTITVLPVNDAPSFVVGPNQMVNNSDGAQTINPWATGISAGPLDESGQALTFNIINNSAPGLFSVLPAVASDGTLTYTPDPALVNPGTATIMLNLSDDGGTANGGVDTSVTQSFTIEVITAVPPTAMDDSVTATTNISIAVDAAGGLLSNDDDGGGTITVTSFDANSTNGGEVTVAADGSFTYDPPAGFTGDDTFDYTITNSAGSDTGTATVTVSGNTIWFIDDDATAGGSGRLSDPFDGIAAFNAVQGGGGTADPAEGDFIFMFSGSYTGSFALLNNQTLFGQGTSGIGFDAFTGITPPAGSTARPGLNGADPVISTTAAATTAINVAANSTIRGLNIGNTTSYGIAGTSSGTLAISQVDITGTGGLLDIDGAGGGILGAAFGALTSTSSNVPNVIDVQNFGLADLTATSTSIQSPSQNGVLLQSNVGASVLNFGNFATLQTTNGAGFVVNNSGTVTISPPSPVTVQTVGGPALDLSNTTFNGFNFSSVSANNTTTGVNLTNVSGFISSGGGTIQNTTGDAFVITGGSNSVTYGGMINNTAGRAVVVTGHTGGNVVFNPINDSAVGVFLNNNAGTSFFFSGTMTLNTGTNNAFTATNGGSIDATGVGSSITTTTGTAVNINGVLIRNTGFAVQSVSSNGSTNGIVLNNTGVGTFSVTGNGTCTCTAASAANCSGGIIQNTTAAAISLMTVGGVSLNCARVQNTGDDGIQGSNVINLALQNSVVINAGNAVGENGIDIDGMFGTGNMINNSSVTRSAEFNVNIENTIATNAIPGIPDTLTVLNSNFGDNEFNGTGADGIFFGGLGTANMRIDVNGMNCTDCRTDGLQADAGNNSSVESVVTNSTFDSNNIGLNITGSGAATMSFDINSNPNFTNHESNIINIAHGVGNGSVDGRLMDNPNIDGSNTGNGVRIISEGDAGAGPNSRVLVDNNIIQGFNNPFGIQATARVSVASLDITIEDNVVEMPGPFASDGIRVESGNSNATSANTVCLDIEDLAAAGGGGNNDSTTLAFDEGYELQQRTGTTFQLEGLNDSDCGGSACSGTVATQVEEFIIDTNTGTANVRTAGRIVNYTHVASCAAPVL